jgi:glycine/D-amino acid oxidase-like deaminating enzyme
VSSYWLETAGDDLTPRDPLDGSERVDVVIVGAGFSGLWTAWYLRQRDPTLRVLVVEAETVGFGASGRNGAWLSAGIAVTPTELVRRTSPATARATILAMRDTVEEVIRVCDREGIDAQVRRGGVLRVGRGPHEAPSMRAAWTALDRLGLADELTLLDAVELERRVRVAGAVGGLHDPYGAVIHPGRLVRGLARRVETAGVRIAERTPVTAVEPRDGSRSPALPRVLTPRGTVTADAVVLACEAWLAQLPGHRRDVLPLYSLVVLTEPIDDDRWSAIGWDGHECLSSHRYTVDYLSRTVDGRILFGGRGAPYHFGSRIEPAYDRDPATHAALRRQLTGWFPALAGIRFSHQWGGPLGMPRDWCPSFRFDATTGIAAAYGYTGQGVSTTNLAGRVLAELLTTGETVHAGLPMVGHRSRRWEPEPLRYLGARYLQRALARIDARAARTGRAPTGRSLAERFVRH